MFSIQEEYKKNFHESVQKILIEWKPYNAIFTTLVVLKVFGLIDVSWWVAVTPFLIFWIPVLILSLMVVCMIGLSWLIDKITERSLS